MKETSKPLEMKLPVIQVVQFSKKVPGDLLDVTYGDLDPNEGSIIYIQNDIPVSREQNQSEEIRVILEF